jgi:hypothetical protein
MRVFLLLDAVLLKHLVHPLLVGFLLRLLKLLVLALLESDQMVSR